MKNKFLGICTGLAILLSGGCIVSHEKVGMTPLEMVSFHHGYTQEQLLQRSRILRNPEAFFAGAMAAKNNEPFPFTDEEMLAAFEVFEDECLAKNRNENVYLAESFLKAVSNDSEIIELLPGKLYYKILHEGKGPIVDEEDLLRASYTAFTLKAGEEVELFSTDEPVEISVSTTIPGFRAGIANIRVGEQRKLFIHPELARGGLDPNANQLLILDVLAVEKILQGK